MVIDIDTQIDMGRKMKIRRRGRQKAAAGAPGLRVNP